MRQTYPGTWLLTSATLAGGEDFGHFHRALGLADAQTLRLDSPFDYTQQARLYLPRGLPEPNDPGYSAAVAAAAQPVIETAGGGAVMLCTSHIPRRQRRERRLEGKGWVRWGGIRGVQVS